METSSEDKRSQHRVEAAIAGTREARLLEIDRGAPLLVLRL